MREARATSAATGGKPLLQALRGVAVSPPPVWFMRQAGRYLPEYRQLRHQVRNFLELCVTPELAAEATLQPLRRYALDAAILFSDILVVPHALGQSVRFREGEGPVLAPIRGPAEAERLSLDDFAERVAPVFRTIERVASPVAGQAALIGLSRAPRAVPPHMSDSASRPPCS